MNVHLHFDFIYRTKQGAHADLVAATLAEELTTADALQAKTQELTQKFEEADKSLNRWEWVASVCFGMLMAAATFGALKRAFNPVIHAHGISPLNVSVLLIFVIFGSLLALGLLNFILRERTDRLQSISHALGLVGQVTSAKAANQVKSLSPEAQVWLDYALETRGTLCYFDLKIMQRLANSQAA